MQDLLARGGADITQLRRTNTAIQAQQVTMECGGSFRATSPDTQVKTPSTPPTAIAASEAAPCLHPPTRPEDKLAAK